MIFWFYRLISLSKKWALNFSLFFAFNLEFFAQDLGTIGISSVFLMLHCFVFFHCWLVYLYGDSGRCWRAESNKCRLQPERAKRVRFQATNRTTPHHMSSHRLIPAPTANPLAPRRHRNDACPDPRTKASNSPLAAAVSEQVLALVASTSAS